MEGWSFSEYAGKNAIEWLNKTKKEKDLNDSSTLIST